MSDEQTQATPPEKAASAKEASPDAEVPAVEDKAQAEPVAPEAKAAAADKKAAAKKGAVAKKKGAAKKRAVKKKPPPFERPQNVTRREFLNLAWLGSMALLTVQTLGVSVLFLFPKFKEGDFGGIFKLQGTASTLFPKVNGAPVPFSNGKFWLTNTEKGAYAIYQICTHLGCLYAWADVTQRFECPCHGSKFSLTGKYLAGPAPRSLDRFKIIATKPDGRQVETPENGAGIQLDGDETLEIDTGTRIKMPGKVEV